MKDFLIQRAYAANGFDFNIFSIKTGDATIGGLVSNLSTLITVIAAVVAFFFFIYSGFLYLTANGNPDQAKKGQAGIVNAIIGLVIIALAYVLLRVIANALGGTDTDLDNIGEITFYKTVASIFNS